MATYIKCEKKENGNLVAFIATKPVFLDELKWKLDELKIKH